MTFDPKRYVIKVQGGREYLPVSARLVWFRNDHPDWGIVTEPMEINHEKQYAIFRASIFNEEGRLIATATKREDVRGFPDYLEKSETGSVGRALAMCGYGTQFAPELEEGPRGGRTPMGRPAGPNGATSVRMAPPDRPTPPMNRPAAPPAVRQELPPPIEETYDVPPERPSRPAPPMNRPAPPIDESRERESEPLPPLRPASALNRPAPRPMPAGDAGAPPPGRPAPSGAPIQRVREPEREAPDPGGSDDFEDPFAQEQDAPAPRPAPSRPAPVRRPPPKVAPNGESLL